MKILVVDDDRISRETLAAMLQKYRYEVITAASGREALDILAQGDCRMVISDWVMPEMNGPALCRAIREGEFSGYVYVILLTARKSNEDVVEGLSAGADDFMIKPFYPSELRVRIRAGERILALESRDLTIFALAKLAESRDPEMGEHLERLRRYAKVLAEHLAELPKYRGVIDAEFLRLLFLTAPLHDIGKVAIRDDVLMKSGRLTVDEYEILKTHTTQGADTLEAALDQHPEAAFLCMARDIALTHHERYDGTGYPAGLAGDDIPLAGRIVALADVYDAMTSARVYKEPFDHETARHLIVTERGKQFDPDVVDGFVASEKDFVEIGGHFADVALMA
jgi:putative two-component system response regulator